MENYSLYKVHPDYQKNFPDLRRARACYDGESAVKAAGMEFLPMPDSEPMTPDEYKQLHNFANFVNYVNPTVDTAVGLMTQNRVETDYPLGEIIRELMVTGRCIILEAPIAPRPTVFKSEEVYDWATDDFGDITYLAMQRRTIQRLSTDSGSNIRWTNYQFIKQLNGKWLHIRNVSPAPFNTFNNDRKRVHTETLQNLPVKFIGVDRNSVEIQVAPMQAIADLNIQHYKLGALVNRAAYRAGEAKLVISGASASEIDSVQTLHSGDALAFKDPTAKAVFVQSLETSNAMARLEKIEQEIKERGAVFASEGKASVTTSSANMSAVNKYAVYIPILNNIEEALGITIDRAFLQDATEAAAEAKPNSEINSEERNGKDKLQSPQESN